MRRNSECLFQSTRKNRALNRTFDDGKIYESNRWKIGRHQRRMEKGDREIFRSREIA